MTQVIQTPKQQHYLRKLLDFACTFEIGLEKSNRVLDDLSIRDIDDSFVKLENIMNLKNRP